MKSDKKLPLSEAEIKKAVRPERYAEVLAHLLHFRDADPREVVKRLGISPEIWSQADAFWAGELELGIRRQQRELALRFSTALARARVQLAKKGPALSSIGTLDDAPHAPAVRAEEAPSPAPSALQALPSFMAVRDPAPAVPPPVAPAPPVVPPPVPPPAAIAPNMAPVQPAPLYTAPHAPAARPRTMAIPAAAAPEERKIFAEGVSPDIALKSAIEHAEVTQGPRSSVNASAGLTEPAQADEIAAIAQRLLPFGPGGAPKKPPPLPAPPPPPEAPVQTPLHNSAPSMPLERQASLHVELSLHPEQRAEILQRYGLTAEQHAHAHAALQARLAVDVALRSAWDSACAQYRTWLLRAK